MSQRANESVFLRHPVGQTPVELIRKTKSQLMAVDETHRESVRERFQFRLRTLFLWVATAAIVCALCHYYGGIVLFLIAIGSFVIFFLVVAPALVAEVVVLAIDTSSRFLHWTARTLRRRFQR
jgi:hypothetical protein